MRALTQESFGRIQSGKLSRTRETLILWTSVYDQTSIKAGAPENKSRDFMIEESCALYHEKVFYNKFIPCYSLNHDDIN